MSDSDATQSDSQSDTSDVARLEGDWYGRQELADRLNVALRTIDRRVNRGEIEKRDTPNGKIYRSTQGTRETQSDTERQQNDTQRDSDRATQSDSKTTPDVSLSAEAWARLLAQTESKDERIQGLEREVGRLGFADSELQRTRDRIKELSDTLEELRRKEISIQAKLHLERGRRELAEERLADRDARIARLEAEVQELRDRPDPEENSKRSPWSFFSS